MSHRGIHFGGIFSIKEAFLGTSIFMETSKQNQIDDLFVYGYFKLVSDASHTFRDWPFESTSTASFYKKKLVVRWASARNTPSSSLPSPQGCAKVWSPSSSWWGSSRTSRTSAVCPFPSSAPWSCHDSWDAASSRAPRRWSNGRWGR